MHSSILISAALTAVAFASPVEKRAEVVVTQTDITYVTDIVTVTAGQPIPTTSPPAPAPAQNRGTDNSDLTSWSTSYYVVPSAAPEAYTAASAAPDSSTAASAAVGSQAPAAASYSPPQNTATTDAQSPTEASTAMATTYQEAVINHHNYHRANHSAPDVSWDDDLAGAAMTVAKNCGGPHITNLQAGPYSSYGQNFGSGTNFSPGNVGDVITDLWYNGEISDYIWYGGETGNWEDAGHATEVIWASVTKVGCATTYCSPSVGWFTVCNYYPSGNCLGEYAQNVLAPKGEATIDGSYNVNTQVIDASYQAGQNTPSSS